MKLYTFGYGSLMNPVSVSKALMRPVPLHELIPVTIHGYKRVWSLKEHVFAEDLQHDITAVFLDITPDAAAMTNGVLIQVTPGEWDSLQRREKNYDRIDITHAVSLEEDCAVYTFMSKEENRLSEGEHQHVYIMRRYIDLVESACAQLGDRFTNLYKATTQDASLTILDGSYRFIDPHQSTLV